MINKNHFNEIQGDEITEPPIYCNSQTPSVRFKYGTHYTKTIPVVLDFMGRLNNHDIYNGDVEFYTSDYALESTPDYISELDKTPVKKN